MLVDKLLLELKNIPIAPPPQILLVANILLAAIVLEEILLRYFNKIKKNNKKWFLTPEMAIYYKLYTVNV